MAKLHGIPGRYGRGQARKQFRRMFLILALSVLLVGFAAGFYYSAPKSFLLLGVTVGASGIVWLVVTKLEPLMDEMADERLRQLKGAEAERLVGWLLMGLDDTWHLFNSLQLEEARDIDHVLVGPGGLWAVSTKSHRGTLAVSPTGQLLCNRTPEKWLGDVKFQARAVNERLRALLGSDVPFCQPLLAVPFMYVDCRAPQGPVYIAHKEELIDVIERNRRPLKAAQIKRLVEALDMLDKTAKRLYRAPEREPAPAPQAPPPAAPAIPAAPPPPVTPAPADAP